MSRGANVKMRRCADEKMWKTRRCEDEQMSRWDGVRKAVKMKRWERMWKLSHGLLQCIPALGKTKLRSMKWQGVTALNFIQQGRCCGHYIALTTAGIPCWYGNLNVSSGLFCFWNISDFFVYKFSWNTYWLLQHL